MNSFSDYLNEALDAASKAFESSRPNAKILPPVTEEQQLAKDLEILNRQIVVADICGNKQLAKDLEIIGRQRAMAERMSDEPTPENIEDIVRKCGRLD